VIECPLLYITLHNAEATLPAPAKAILYESIALILLKYTNISEVP
jgi:hypothetical protein